MDQHAPDFWVAFVVYAACRGRGYAAVGWGIVIGLLRDAHSLDPLGTHGFVLGLLGFVFAEGRTDRGRVQGFARAACLFLAVVGAGWLYVLRMLPLGGDLALAPFLDVFPTALFTTLVALPLYGSVDRFGALDDLLGRRRGLPA
jgi:rod shape-determining protein MreD